MKTLRVVFLVLGLASGVANAMTFRTGPDAYGAGAVKDAQLEEHYTCFRCRAVFRTFLLGRGRTGTAVRRNEVCVQVSTSGRATYA